MNRRLKAVVIVLSAGFIGAAVGRIHRELAQRGDDLLIQRVDRLERLKPMPDLGAPARSLQDLSRVPAAPRIALPTPPKPTAVLEPGRTKEDPALSNLPENLLLPLSPAKSGTPAGTPARSPGTTILPGPSPKPVAALSGDQQISGFLTAARQAVAAGAFGEARALSSKAAGLSGSAERLAEARRLETLAALGEKILPESNRWKEAYAGGWISIQLRSLGKVVEGREFGETSLGYVIGRRNSRQTVPKAEAGKVERLASSQARARFEAEAWVRAEEAGEDASRAGKLMSAAKFAWEMNLPEAALEILGQAVDADPSISSSSGVASVPGLPGPAPLAVVPSPVLESVGSSEEEQPPAAPGPAPGALGLSPPPASKDRKTGRGEAPRKGGKASPKSSGGPRSGSLSAAVALNVAGTNARHEGRRDESVQKYNEAIAMLKPLLSGSERKEACLELARAEHGLGSVYLVRKDWATAYTHYKNSCHYYEIGDMPIRLKMSGSIERVQQMTQALGGRVPNWKTPE